MLLYGTVARMRYRTEPCHTLTHGTYAKVSYILTTSLLASFACVPNTYLSSELMYRATTDDCALPRLIRVWAGPWRGVVGVTTTVDGDMSTWHLTCMQRQREDTSRGTSGLSMDSRWMPQCLLGIHGIE